VKERGINEVLALKQGISDLLSLSNPRGPKEMA